MAIGDVLISNSFFGNGSKEVSLTGANLMAAASPAGAKASVPSSEPSDDDDMTSAVSPSDKSEDSDDSDESDEDSESESISSDDGALSALDVADTSLSLIVDSGCVWHVVTDRNPPQAWSQQVTHP